MTNKRFLLLIACLVIVTIGLTMLILTILPHNDTLQTESIAVHPVSSTITAQGTIHSQNEATLHFQTAGKLTYLPFQEGDAVTQGQTIARLDTYALQRQLQLAANAYETAQTTNNQTQENNQAGVIEGQQRVSLDTTNKNSYNNTTEAQVITDAVKRIVDNNQLAQNSAQINVDLANYAIQLANLTAPFSGVITNEDVTVANQNVTPTTSFSIADPNSLVFRANVLATDIDFVSEGSPATIQIDGQNKTYQGTVVKVYPNKTTLASGQDVYQVDIENNDVSAFKLGQNGTVTIQSNTNSAVTLVPTWTILSHTYLWVMEDNKPVLKKITVGKTHGQEIEVTGGLLPDAKIIVNPKGIASEKYQLL